MIKNIVFTGGGLKGWAYIGTIQALEEYVPFKQIEQVIGVSIGSFFGLCYVLQIKWDFLLDYSMDINLKEYIDINLDNLLLNQSISEGIKMTELFKEVISHKVDPDITFEQLRKATGVLFTVNALNATDSKLEYFNYTLTPDIKVIDAVRASCNLPFMFPGYTINGKDYYDGGLCNNCPIDLGDELYTIAFDVSHETTSSGFKIIDLFMSLSVMNNKFHHNSTAENIYKILDIKFKDDFVNVNQTKDDIFNIYMDGYTNSKNILFKNHKAIK